MKKILVIDDELEIHDSINKQLKNENITLTNTCDPREALKLINSTEFDIILCDIFLNNISGIDILKDIKLNRPDIQVILMTGFYDNDLEKEAKKYGTIDFLTKPILKKDLINAIHSNNRIF